MSDVDTAEELPTMLPAPALVSKRGAHLKKYQFPKGVSGNPSGRKYGTRNTLTGNFLKELAADFEKHGPKVISRARERDPMGYLKVIAGLLPKQLEKVSVFEEMTDAELAGAIEVLRRQMSINHDQPA